MEVAYNQSFIIEKSTNIIWSKTFTKKIYLKQKPMKHQKDEMIFKKSKQFCFFICHLSSPSDSFEHSQTKMKIKWNTKCAKTIWRFFSMCCKCKLTWEGEKKREKRKIDLFHKLSLFPTCGCSLLVFALFVLWTFSLKISQKHFKEDLQFWIF
jgi:hypothetical protein